MRDDGWTKRARGWAWGTVAVAAVAAGCWMRWTDLGRAATRSDEINQLRYAEQGAGV